MDEMVSFESALIRWLTEVAGGIFLSVGLIVVYLVLIVVYYVAGILALWATDEIGLLGLGEIQGFATVLLTLPLASAILLLFYVLLLIYRKRMGRVVRYSFYCMLCFWVTFDISLHAGSCSILGDAVLFALPLAELVIADAAICWYLDHLGHGRSPRTSKSTENEGKST
jgi:hypothetical protein